MSSLQKITSSQAILLWNTFLSTLPNPVPFSFNPSLFNFYKNHFNWKPYYILVFKEDEVCAVLPLVNTRKAWVSIPHFSYGGMLLKHGDKPFSIEKIIESISDKEPGYYRIDTEELISGNSNTSKMIFIRSLKESAPVNAVKSEKVTSIIQLPDSSEKMMDMLSSNLRRKIKKAEASDIKIKIGGKELVADFYNVYSKNIYYLNSLNYGISFFNDLIDRWNHGSANFFVAYADKKPIGAAMLLSYMGYYENAFFATLVENRKEYISDLLHWNMVTHCIKHKNETEYLENHIPVYSFGRSTVGSGVYKYKNHWPVTNYPLYNYLNFPDFRKNSWLLNIWAKLPFAIAKPLGAKLIKHIY